MTGLLEVKECCWKDEHYLVREDGFILRKAKEGYRKRKLDEVWSVGSMEESTGYCKFGGERVHLIVATAFYGQHDTKKFIVEHIDGNRTHNSPSNLRWISKLQAAFDNRDNIQKLLIYFPNGLQEFLDNPPLLKQRGCAFNEISWMADVTSDEAKEAYEKSKNNRESLFIERTKQHNPSVKTKKDNFQPFEEGENIAEFLKNSERESRYQEKMEEFLSFIPKTEDWKFFMTDSPTPLVLQDNWMTPTEFPCCPDKADEDTIRLYHERLSFDTLFCKNELWQSYVLDTALSEDDSKLWVLTDNKTGLKRWALAEIYIKEGFIVHCAVGTFFEKVGAEKQFTLIQGKEWTGGETFDDYC